MPSSYIRSSSAHHLKMSDVHIEHRIFLKFFGSQDIGSSRLFILSHLKTSASILMKIQTKIITVAGTVIMIGVIILALNPFQSVFSYKLQYLRQTAKEVAEALEKETPIRLTEQFYTNEQQLIQESMMKLLGDMD